LDSLSLAVWGVLALLLVTAGCTNTNATGSSSGSGIRVIATVGMVADIVREVGGDRVAVTQPMAAGVDPHLYKATRDDVARMSEADMVFYSGLMLEGKMTDSLIKIARGGKPVIAVTEKIDESKLLEPEDFAGHPDPHVWMDAELWGETVKVVAEELSKFDPDHKSEYAARAEQYLAQVGKLREYGRTVMATIPKGSRVLITSHDAFNYFGRAYDLEVQGVQGISTESEAGLKRINELVDLLVERKVKAVFIESSVSPKNIQALVDGAKSRGHEVRIGGELFSDAMGPADTYEGTYIGMIDHNITTVVRALGGEAPDRGMSGKLAPAGT
jgi:manganese/zinc/iron transport system substrate-binding protein